MCRRGRRRRHHYFLEFTVVVVVVVVVLAVRLGLVCVLLSLCGRECSVVLLDRVAARRVGHWRLLAHSLELAAGDADTVTLARLALSLLLEAGVGDLASGDGALGVPDWQGVLFGLCLLARGLGAQFLGRLLAAGRDADLKSGLGGRARATRSRDGHELRGRELILVFGHGHRVCDGVVKVVERHLDLVDVAQEALDLGNLAVHALDLLVAELGLSALLVVDERVRTALAQEQAEVVALERDGVEHRVALAAVRSHVALGVGAVVDRLAHELGELRHAKLNAVDGAAELNVVVRAVHRPLLPVLLLRSRVSAWSARARQRGRRARGGIHSQHAILLELAAQLVHLLGHQTQQLSQLVVSERVVDHECVQHQDVPCIVEGARNALDESFRDIHCGRVRGAKLDKVENVRVLAVGERAWVYTDRVVGVQV